LPLLIVWKKGRGESKRKKQFHQWLKGPFCILWNVCGNRGKQKANKFGCWKVNHKKEKKKKNTHPPPATTQRRESYQRGKATANRQVQGRRNCPLQSLSNWAKNSSQREKKPDGSRSTSKEKKEKDRRRKKAF